MITSISIITANAEEPLYTYDSNTKTLTINIQGEMKYGHTNAPWLNIEYPEHIVLKKGVTSISDFGFSFAEHGNGGERLNNYDRIKTVKLPDTLKTIGWGAFENCHKLEKINIPKSVNKIDCCAFAECENLKKITIPGSIKSLELDTFDGCKNLKNVIMKKGVKKIGFGVFGDCKRLKTVKIPSSLKSIGQGAFCNCKVLSKIKLPNKLKTIKMFAFIGCTKLKKIIVPKSVKKIGTEAFGYKGHDMKLKGFTIKGYKGTVAEKYAKKNKFRFIALKKK
jgi:hypothetical protein